MKDKNPYTKEEQRIMSLLVDAHNFFVKTESTHKDDTPEWVEGIHKCQTVMMRRILRREYPHIFTNESL